MLPARRGHLERHHHFEDWFKHVQDIPGAFYLWIVEHLFVDNRFVAGTLEIGGERVDLGRIGCPLFLLGGARDHITPPAQVFAAADYVSTPGADVETHVNSGGDLGLFMGSEALREHWPPMLAAFFARSRRDADTAAAKATPRRSGLVASDGAVVAGRVAACLDAAARGSPQATVMPRPTRCDDTTIDTADSLSDGSERDDPDAPEPPRDIVVPERAEQAELRTAPEGIAATTMEDVRAASGG